MKNPLWKPFWCKLGSQLRVLWEKFYSIKLQILNYYESFYWRNMPRAVHIFFSGHKEICYTVLNEPHREPMEQQISLAGRMQSSRGNPVQLPQWMFFCFVMFCLKNHIFKRNRNWNQSEEPGSIVINPTSIWGWGWIIG